MGTPVDFDLAVLILRVLEAWELGNRCLYRKYRAYKKSSKFQNFILVPGIQKNDFYDFSGIFLRKNGPGIWESRVRRPVVRASSETPCGDYHEFDQINQLK